MTGNKEGLSVKGINIKRVTFRQYIVLFCFGCYDSENIKHRFKQLRNINCSHQSISSCPLKYLYLFYASCPKEIFVKSETRRILLSLYSRPLTEFLSKDRFSDQSITIGYRKRKLSGIFSRVISGNDKFRRAFNTFRQDKEGGLSGEAGPRHF